MRSRLRSGALPPPPPPPSVSASMSAGVRSCLRVMIWVISVFCATDRSDGSVRVAQPPYRGTVVGRGLVDLRPTVERGAGIGRVERGVGRISVEAAAPHVRQVIDGELADRADLALEAGLAQDPRRGKA